MRRVKSIGRVVRILTLIVVMAMISTVVGVLPASAQSDLQCFDRANKADYTTVTVGGDGDDDNDGHAVVDLSNTGTQAIIIDIQDEMESVTINMGWGNDDVCIINTGPDGNDDGHLFEVSVKSLFVDLSTGDDQFMFVSPLSKKTSMTVEGGAGADYILTPLPLYKEGEQNSNLNGGGNQGDTLEFFATGDKCGIQISQLGVVGPTTEGDCGDTADAVRILKKTTGLVAAVVRSLVKAGIIVFTGNPSVAEVVSAVLGIILGPILKRMIDVYNAGVDISGFWALRATPGPDRIDYAHALKMIVTGEGADTIIVRDSVKRDLAIDAGPGMSDVVDFSFRDNRVEVDLADQTLKDGHNLLGGTIVGVERVIGTKGDDIILGSHGPNILNGLKGNDTIKGRSGVDIIDGGTGNDRLYGGPGDDRIEGHDQNDELYGGTGDDILDGEVGDDELTGGPGDDWLRGVSMNTGGTIRDIWHGEGRDVLTGNSGRDVCDFAGPDSASGCEARQVGGEGEIRLYTRSLVDPELGYSTPFSEAPNLSKLGEGDRAMCKTSGKVRAKLPGHMPPISDLNPSDVKTTVERTKITADPGLTVKGASSRVVTGLSTDSWTRLTWVTVEATQDAEYSIDYAVTADYNGLKQKRTFSGAMHCNTALIDANSSVREGFALFFDTTGNTKGVTFDWDVDRTSGWAFAPGTGASSPKPAIYFTDDGTYNVTLTVTTPIGRKITDTHTVTVLANRPPVAHAGPDATTRNATYQLNGAGSHDPDGDPLTSFQWTKPAGVDWEPGSGSSSVRPWIRFSDFGSYTFELEVCARGGCDTDEVRISYWPFQ